MSHETSPLLPEMEAHQEASELLQDETSQAEQTPSEHQVTEPAPEKIDYEAEAKKLGWNDQFVPKQPWQKKRTAKEFLEVYEQNSIGRQADKHLKREIEQLKQALQDKHERTVKFAQEQEQEARARALAELEALQERVVEEGNVHAWKELEAKKKELSGKPLKADQLKEVPPAPAQAENVDPVFQQFNQENSWYGKDEDLTLLADSLAPKFNSQGYSKGALLERVAQEVRRIRPDKFEVKASRGDSVNESESAGRSSGSVGIVNLPNEARREAEDFVSKGLQAGIYKTKAEAQKEFLRLYNM